VSSPDSDVSVSIHSAAITVFLARPYAEFTVEAVAEEAGVDPAALAPRRAAELIIDALLDVAGPTIADPGTADSLRTELLAIANGITRLYTEHSELMLAVLYRLRDNPDLDRAFRERYLLPRLTCARKVFGTAVLRAQLRPDADMGLILSLAPALLGYRAMIRDPGPDERFAERFVDSVLLPLLMKVS
jgi:AcrR family transcriptional regulator